MGWKITQSIVVLAAAGTIVGITGDTYGWGAGLVVASAIVLIDHWVARIAKESP